MATLPEAVSVRRRFSAKADVALAVAVLSIVAILLIPLPPLLLDVLLAANLTFSVVALLVTLYVSSAAQISAFPVLLLLAALARVSLSVAATRLILVHGNAGSIIRSFGDFVVRGNFVVGVVLFTIITIVEFVVVARGSERVAEVAARFTLDALPGKQMAIDADTRSGLIDAGEARRRRVALERESHFYGAMDGAMKFVKGDVVASTVIAIVNLGGGFAIGIGQRGLDWEHALHRYGLLAIGAGLVAQVPALLLATSAGVLVTRVATDEDAATLGADVERQLFANPRALGLAASFSLVLALVPGLPAAPFALMAAVLFLLARSRKGDRRSESTLFGAPDSEAGEAVFAPLAEPWSLELSSDVAAAVGKRALDRSAVSERIRSKVFGARGVPLPTGRVGVDPALPDRNVVLSIHEVPARVIALPSDVPASETAGYVEERVSALLVERAADFLGIAEVKLLVDELEKRSPAVVRQVVPKAVDLPILAELLRRLVDEGWSIRDLKGILEAVLRAPPGERDGGALAEHVRAEMRRAITYALTEGSGKLDAFVLDAHIEEAVRGAITRGASGSFVSLGPATVRDIVAAVRRALETHGPGIDTPVLLVPSDIRRFVRELVETDFPRLRVIAHGELLPEIVVNTLGRAAITAHD